MSIASYSTKTKNGTPFKIIKESDDRQGILRVSMGGVDNKGFYTTFRGDINEVADMMNELNELFQKARIKFLEQNN